MGGLGERRPLREAPGEAALEAGREGGRDGGRALEAFPDAGRVGAHPDDPRRAADVIEGDAFDLTRTLGAEAPRFAGIISGLPLLNFPLSKRNLLIEGAMARLQPGGPLVQFSYGLEPPVHACSRFKVARAATVWANLPPARIWLYSPAR